MPAVGRPWPSDDYDDDDYDDDTIPQTRDIFDKDRGKDENEKEELGQRLTLVLMELSVKKCLC